MDTFVLVVFLLVYAGMFLGEFPGLALDRAGFALLGGIILIAAKRVLPEAAWRAVDVPTIGILFGLMVISAQFRIAGFYARLTQRIAAVPLSPPRLLGLLIAATGVLSALLGNDIVCLAVTPVLLSACIQRGVAPLPFLLALAAASNIGSAATLIGNPQNVLIGEALQMSFAAYLLDGGVPATLGLFVVWAVLAWQFRRRWTPPAGDARPPGISAQTGRATAVGLALAEWPFDRRQSAKGLLVLGGLIAAFLFTSWPRDVIALVAGGLLLISRRLSTRDALALVDWHLIVLFIGLFVVNHALEASGTLAALLDHTRSAGIATDQPATLFGLTVVLSNLVSNVPATMLLLKATHDPRFGPLLCLASTFAGNLIVVGSVANIIVVEQARLNGLRIGWREHARSGVPITVLTLLLAGAWLWVRNA